MASTWLPTWLGIAWSAVFAIILVVHLWHVLTMTGRDRLWHGVHVLMATGMLAMFVPTDDMVVPAEAGVAVFAAAAVVVALLLVRERVNHGDIGRLWLVAVIDLAAMAYMFAMMFTRITWVTIALVGWFALQAAGWSTGRLFRLVVGGGLAAPTQVSREASSTPDRVGSGLRKPLEQHSMPDGQAHQGSAQHTTHQDGAHRTAICATLTLMSLGMAYMLIAMHFGMPTAHEMPGMHEMSAPLLPVDLSVAGSNRLLNVGQAL